MFGEASVILFCPCRYTKKVGKDGDVMITIAGNVRETVKRTEDTNQWVQKKQEAARKYQEQLDPETKQLLQYQEGMQRIRESGQMAELDQKLQSGEVLTPEEKKYLQEKNPEAYRQYMEVQNAKKAYERQLRQCETKEDVEKLKNIKMGTFLAEAKSIASNSNIPEGKKLGLLAKIQAKVHGIQKVHIKFTNTVEYQSLPEEETIKKQGKASAKTPMAEELPYQENEAVSVATDNPIKISDTEVNSQISKLISQV